MSDTVEKKRDDAMQIVADLCFQNDYWYWNAFRVVKYKNGLYLMTDEGHSGLTPFEYVEGHDFKEFINNTGEQFTDHATGPLTRFQTLAELMSLLNDLDVPSEDIRESTYIDMEDLEKAVHDILATNINKTNKEEQA